MIDNIFYWNVRWLGRSRKRLKLLVNKSKVALIAITEPFVREQHMVNLANFLNLHFFQSNEIEGGKLWIFWKEQDAFEVLSYTSQSILGWYVSDNQRILVTFVYAKCTYVERRELWQALTERHTEDYPWVVMGDFNAIRSDSERIGGSPRPLISMSEFNECLNSCGLLEATSNGHTMSLCNGHVGTSRSWANLDRVIFNICFANRFTTAKVELLDRKSSDHCPLLLFLETPFSAYGPAPFRFMNMWGSHENFLPCVKEAWNQQDSAHGLLKLSI